MAKVFVPQVPSRYDTRASAAGMWVPTMNIGPARKFGEVVVVLPPEASRMTADRMPELVDRMREAMHGMTREDCLVAVGDPSLIAAAACIAVERTDGLLRVLKWDRIAAEYQLVEITI